VVEAVEDDGVDGVDGDDEAAALALAVSVPAVQASIT